MLMRNMMTSARFGRRRAITSMLAMLYLVLFAMLAVGFYDQARAVVHPGVVIKDKL